MHRRTMPKIKEHEGRVLLDQGPTGVVECADGERILLVNAKSANHCADLGLITISVDLVICLTEEGKKW